MLAALAADSRRPILLLTARAERALILRDELSAWNPALQPLLFAVNMLVNTEAGDTYSFSEMSAWLSAAGFQDPRRLEAPGPSPLVLATKPA